MTFHHFRHLLREADQRLGGAASRDVPDILRPFSPELFGLMLWRRDQLQGDYPNLFKLLPPLPPPEIQQRFAGAQGEALLPMACAFVSYLDKIAHLHLERPLHEAEIIDYGCGWGRLTRFLIKFTDVQKIRALDPDEQVLRYLDGTVLERCTRRIPRVPELFSPEAPADLIFMFSILTHTPPKMTALIAQWMRRVLKPGGVLVFTIRPRAYWNFKSDYPEGYNAAALSQAHDAEGFAYLPHGPGNEEYGDSSYTDEAILKIFTDFDLLDRTFSISDTLQLYYTMRRR